MKSIKKILKLIKRSGGEIVDVGEDGLTCTIPRSCYFLCIVAFWGKGWDHVSIHAQADKEQQFCPFWEDMCYAKQLFFKDSETVIQYHPAKSKYVNCHPHTLHLWRPQEQEIALPPIWMV